MKYGYVVAYNISKHRSDVDHRDIAHEAFCRALRRTKPVPQKYHNHYITLVVRGVFRELYTNKTCRKHDVMLEVSYDVLQQYLPVENNVVWVDVLDMVYDLVEMFEGIPKEVFLLTMQGYNTREIGGRFKRSREWASQHIRKIRCTINRFMQEEYNVCRN